VKLKSFIDDENEKRSNVCGGQQVLCYFITSIAIPGALPIDIKMK